MRIVLTLFFVLTLVKPQEKVGMLGLFISDSESTIEKITLEIMDEDSNSTRYQTVDGNSFSVTTRDGKIVYMENDWLGDPNNRAPLLTDFAFDETSYADIREVLGSGGFFYKAIVDMTLGDYQTLISCFEIKGKKDLILGLAQVIPLHERDLPDAQQRMKLAAIILADVDYLNTIWGKERIYSPGYGEIEL